MDQTGPMDRAHGGSKMQNDIILKLRRFLNDFILQSVWYQNKYDNIALQLVCSQKLV